MGDGGGGGGGGGLPQLLAVASEMLLDVGTAVIGVVAILQCMHIIVTLQSHRCNASRSVRSLERASCWLLQHAVAQ